MNNWLRKWCKQEWFGFLDHGLQFLEDGLLASDGLHLARVGRNVFAKNLKNLIRRALNRLMWGRETVVLKVGVYQVLKMIIQMSRTKWSKQHTDLVVGRKNP